MIKFIAQNVEFINQEIGRHKGIAKDVAWSDNIGLKDDIIASAGDEGKVIIWERPTINSNWEQRTVIQCPTSVSAISWNTTGELF